MTSPPVPVTARDRRVRPLLWRLPLLALLVIGVGCLRYLDDLLQREYRNEAVTQAVQTDALLESFVRHRVALLHSVEVLMGRSGTGRDLWTRFPALAADVVSGAPELVALYFVDADGVVRSVYPETPALRAVVGSNHRGDPDRAVALDRALGARRPSLTRTVVMRDGRRGLMVYDPVVRGDRVIGYVAGSFAYASLFNDALAGQMQRQFAYRVTDEFGGTIAASPQYPSETMTLVTREVTLPDDHRWRLDVAIPQFEPFTARLILWIVGVLLLVLVVFLVIREEARVQRIASHLFDLELLSSNLLDANIRLEERAQQVAEANRAKSRFLANVSHELRTPLNAIVGYNSLAVEGLYGALPAPLAAAHQRIAHAADHLLGLVDEVLDLSKIEVGRMELAPETVDLAALLESVVTVVDPIASAKGVRLDLIVARDLPRIVTDPRHVRQVVLNLASNAIKFTEKGSVSLIARRAEDDPHGHVSIAVQDTGIGIAAADVERIFEEFEQVRPGGRGDSLQRGTGLGLTISRKLARLLGGEVTVSSVVGEGSRFTLLLPLATRATPPSSVAVGHDAGGAGREGEAGDARSATSLAPDGAGVEQEPVSAHAGAHETAPRGERGLDDAPARG